MFDRSSTFYCNTETLYMIWQFIIKNKNIQAQLTDGLDNSQEQKYTGATNITINLIKQRHFIVTQKQYKRSGNLLLRTKIYMRN